MQWDGWFGEAIQRDIGLEKFLFLDPTTAGSEFLNRPRFLINEENSRLVDVSKHAYPDAPPEATGPTVLVCPHCGHDERGGNGPHEIFDVVDGDETAAPVIVSSRHFRCRDCGEISPAWSLRRDGSATTHMREIESGEPCMPVGFHSFLHADFQA